MKVPYLYKIIWPFFLLTTLLSACVKEGSNELSPEEKKTISDYLAAHPEFTETSGIYYHEVRTGTGLSPVKGDYILISFAGRYLSDMTLRETNYDSLRSEWSVSPLAVNYLYSPWKVPYGSSFNGFNVMLAKMKAGGKSVGIFPSNTANYDDEPLLYEIELLAVIPDREEYDSLLIVNYIDYLQQTWLKEPAYISDSAIIYIETDETIVPGPGPAKGDTVYFQYTGRLLNEINGTLSTRYVFDSSGADTMVMQLPSKLLKGTMLNKTVPKGLSIALDTMRAGTHAVAVLPYDQAFQKDGLVHSVYKYMIIPPFQTVVYNISVFKVQ